MCEREFERSRRMCEAEDAEMDCYCYATERYVKVKGVAEKRHDLIRISDCEYRKACPKKGAVDCLIGKLRESRMR